MKPPTGGHRKNIYEKVRQQLIQPTFFKYTSTSIKAQNGYQLKFDNLPEDATGLTVYWLYSNKPVVMFNLKTIHTQRYKTIHLLHPLGAAGEKQCIRIQ